MVDAERAPSSYWQPHERDELERRLAEIAGDTVGGWSFAVAERGAVAGVERNLVRHAASTIKVPLLLAVLAGTADGTHQLDDTVAVPVERTAGSGVLRALSSITALRLDETLELMVTVSDNTATNMLIDLLGLESIEARLGEMGLTNTRLRRHMLDQRAAEAGRDNVATAGELAWLLDRLCGTELLPAELADTALHMLGRQQFNDRMPAYLPADVVSLHKTGELSGVCHDVGIMCFDDRQVAFAAMSSDLPDADGTANGVGPAVAAIGAAARTVVEVARGSRSR